MLNAHLCCSSALSKATGYPLSFVVGKLVLGKKLVLNKRVQDEGDERQVEKIVK